MKRRNRKGPYTGRFSPTNVAKYRGDPFNIIYRSLWELKCMRYFDTNPNILEWSSEEIIIPYKSPLDMKYHRYFPDFTIKIKDKEGHIQTFIVEVKPKVQTLQPKLRKRITPRYLNEIAVYTVNQAKWAAAEKYCADRSWKFQIMTEEQIYPRKAHK